MPLALLPGLPPSPRATQSPPAAEPAQPDRAACLRDYHQPNHLCRHAHSPALQVSVCNSEVQAQVRTARPQKRFRWAGQGGSLAASSRCRRGRELCTRTRRVVVDSASDFGHASDFAQFTSQSRSSRSYSDWSCSKNTRGKRRVRASWQWPLTTETRQCRSGGGGGGRHVLRSVPGRSVKAGLDAALKSAIAMCHWVTDCIWFCNESRCRPERTESRAAGELRCSADGVHWRL